MLYNPNWKSKTVTTEVFSLAGLIQWLETQDPTTPYNYFDPEDCLLTRYFRARGLRSAACLSRTVYSKCKFSIFTNKQNIPYMMDYVARHNMNYGDALKMAYERNY